VYGAIIGGLIGFGATGTEEGATEAAEAGADAFADKNFGLSNTDIQAIANDLPSGVTAVMVLFEHRWAVPLKEAIEEAGGIVVAQGLVRPENLMEFGAQLAARSDAAEYGYEDTQPQTSPSA